jgi:hypothetical protein
MYFHDKRRNNTKVTSSTTSILTLAIIMVVSNMAAVPALATTTSPTSQSGIELSPQPVYQERSTPLGENPINQTHVETSFTSNGTLNLPNGTEPIRTIGRGSGIASHIGTFAGKETITTEDGSESATATFSEIVRFGEQEGRGIAIALFHTNSTGRLAPLDGMILVGIDELPPDGGGMVSLWEWQSGIPLPPTTAITSKASAANSLYG